MRLKKSFLCFISMGVFLFLFIPFSFAETQKVVGPTTEVDDTAPFSEDELSSLNDAAEKKVEQNKSAQPVPPTSSRNQAFGKSVDTGETFEAPPQPLSRAKTLNEIGEEYGFKPQTAPPGKTAAKKKGTQMGMVRMWGHYRLTGGANGEDFILNDANSAFAIETLQGPRSEYIFGERRENTHDPAIYSQYQLNVDFAPKDKWDFYTQIVIDPWSWVGTTGEQIVINNQNHNVDLRYNLKYFGAFNSTIPEIYRNSITDRIAFPFIKTHHSRLTGGTVVQGMDDYDGVSNDKHGLTYNIPELDIDTELRPFRKVWVDYKEDNWHARAFALADQEQALTTDDPLQLSNHRDYWQQSPWLYQYKPVQYFSDNSVKRGYYSDALSYYARDSEGNRLVLLRGASYEADFDRTYIAATVAAPFTPWDQEILSADNIPGAIRIKHQISDRLMGGATYTFREGLIDNSVADDNQVLGVDGKYKINENVDFIAEIAGSHRELDLLTNQATRTSTDGYAYKAEFIGDYDHKRNNGHSEWHLSYAQMDRDFSPLNSAYLNTRDDRFWGTHISFDDHPDLEPFKLGDGLDVNRMVVRLNWKEKLMKDRFYNEFDIRNVHKTRNTAYVETVTRDEITYKLTPKLTVKGLARWRALPRTTPGVDPIFTGFYFPKDDIDMTDFYVQNTAIEADKNADQFTYSGGLQYVVNPKLTAEGIYERTNAIPDFPRGLLNDFYRNPVERIDGILIDRMQNFMYAQGGVLWGRAPYPFYNIFKERLIFKPESRFVYTLHATQNGYRPAGGIDDNINHIGLGVEFVQTKKLTWFADFTYSRQTDIPNYVATNEAEAKYDGHSNFYASLDYRLTASSALRAEYGFFGFRSSELNGNPYNAGVFSLPTIDTEHLLRVSLNGDF